MEMTHAGGILKRGGAGQGAPVPGAAAYGAAVQGGSGQDAAVAAASSPDMRLAELATGAEARVVSVGGADAASLDLGRRLAELGFLPGEKLRIVARGLMSREPLAVRIGTGTFALRLFEAACIRVTPELPSRR